MRKKKCYLVQTHRWWEPEDKIESSTVPFYWQACMVVALLWVFDTLAGVTVTYKIVKVENELD